MAIDYSQLPLPKGSRVLDRDAKDMEAERLERACRVAVLKRDGLKCRVPGCKERSAHHHHLTYRSHGGKWTTANIVRLCPRHHRLVHSGHLQISGNADAELIVTGQR